MQRATVFIALPIVTVIAGIVVISKLRYSKAMRKYLESLRKKKR